MQPMLSVGVHAADRILLDVFVMCLSFGYHHSREDDVVFVCACVCVISLYKFVWGVSGDADHYGNTSISASCRNETAVQTNTL